jgi:hypothetical protein
MSGRKIPIQHASGEPRLPRCEVDHTLGGGYCEEQREVRLEGLLLCDRHARLLQAQDRVDLLRGIVSCLELCLSNLAVRRDTSLVHLLRAKMAEARASLEIASEEVRRASA